MNRSRKHLTKRQRIFWETILLLVVFVGGSLLHYFVSTKAAWWPTDMGETYFLDAKVTDAKLQLAETSYVFRIYIVFLHTVCKFFGNIYEICLLAHFVLFVIAAFVWYFTIKKMSNWIVAMVLIAMLFIAPFTIVISSTLNPLIMWFLLFGLLVFLIVSCAKLLFANKSNVVNDTNQPIASSVVDEADEPVVTVVNFEEEKAVVVPEQEEKPVIFIPKSMEIHKRVSKPKLDYSEAVAFDAMFYDMDVADLDDFDLPDPF